MGPERGIDGEAEARWIEETLEQAGESAAELDLILTGANGQQQLDGMYLSVAQALSRRAGRPIACGAYKQCCGEYHAASAFGIITAIALVGGTMGMMDCLGQASRRAGWDRPCRKVLLYTLSSTGTKGMCCVRA
jgi:hypothetical protein